MKKSLAFINPPGPGKVYRSMTCTYVSKANYIWQPQDFINLSAGIPPDRETVLIDCIADGLTEADVFAGLRSAAPEVAVTAVSSIVYDADMRFIKRLREHFPETRILALGDVFLEPYFWGRGLEHADALILNSLDVDFNNYLETGSSMSRNLILKNDIQRQKAGNQQALSQKEPPKKVSIGVPRHEVFLNRKYRFPFSRSYLYSTVTAQFGCLFRCGYCSQSKIPVAYRDYTEVVDEVHGIRRLGVRDLFWGDFSFGFPRDNAFRLLEELTRSDARMRWACYANPSIIDRELLGMMKEAGCHTVIVGIEDEDFSLLNQRYDRTLTKDRLIAFCGDCSGLGIRVCGDFIIGLNNAPEAVQRMTDFAGRLKLDYASFNIFTVLFGSRLREEMVGEKMLDPCSVGFDTSGTFGNGLERLIGLRNRAVRSFYMRPSYILKRIAGVRGVEELVIQAQEMVAMIGNIVSSERRTGGRSV